MRIDLRGLKIKSFNWLKVFTSSGWYKRSFQRTLGYALWSQWKGFINRRTRNGWDVCVFYRVDFWRQCHCSQQNCYFFGLKYLSQCWLSCSMLKVLNTFSMVSLVMIGELLCNVLMFATAADAYYIKPHVLAGTSWANSVLCHRLSVVISTGLYLSVIADSLITHSCRLAVYTRLRPAIVETHNIKAMKPKLRSAQRWSLRVSGNVPLEC